MKISVIIFTPLVFLISVFSVSVVLDKCTSNHIEGYYKATVVTHLPLEDKKQKIVFRDYMPKVRFKRSYNYVEYFDTLGNYYKISSIAPIEIENIKRIK